MLEVRSPNPVNPVHPVQKPLKCRAMKLLLWDIDGTLVCTGAAGERALVGAMKSLFQIEASLDQIDFWGRTDAHIGRMLFEHYGVALDEKKLHDFLEMYLVLLQTEMTKGRTKTHPGIVDILEQVRLRADLAQGLLTGNLVRGAEIKLTHFDVWRYFEFGAFADDSYLRNELGPHALRRAKEKIGREFPPENVFVIGDTPHDVACGKIIGAKTIAVATGKFSVEELAKCEPTAVLADFSDPLKFFAVIDQN
jgi:phosphoglycolate phosphatase-like HAD superfamily hydrolase